MSNENIDLSQLHDCGKVKISVSARELKYKDNDNVIVYKMVDGHKTPTSYMQYTDIDSMKENYTQEEIEILAVANLLVRCQNLARNWDRVPAGKVDSEIAGALKGKELTPEQKAKVIAYLSKL